MKRDHRMANGGRALDVVTPWTWLRFGHEVFIEVYDDLSHFGNPTLKPDIIETN
jgi:hypothetical protein